MKKLLKYSFCLVSFLLCFASKAQYSKVHYLPPTYNQSSGLIFSTITVTTLEEDPFDVSIANASGTFQNTFNNLSRVNPITLTLPIGDADGIFLASEGKINQVLASEGFILTADKMFFTSQIHSVTYQGTVIAPKGIAGLGTEFYSGHIHSAEGTNSSRAHFISVMASEDNTTITFDNPAVEWEQRPNNFDVVLNKGESYVVAAPFEYISGLTAADKFNAFNGTHVSADKPIAMNSGSFLASSRSGGQDAGVDQVVPVDQLNDEFILVRGRATDDDLESAMIIATENGTKVFINGNSTASHTLNRGEHVIINGSNYLNNTMHIKTSSPSMVYQNLAGSNSSATVGMVFVPGLMESASRSVMISDVNSLGAISLYIVAKKNEPVTINGKVINLAHIENPGNTEWVSYRLTPEQINASYCLLGNTCANTGVNSDFVIESAGPINAAVSVVSGYVGAAGYFSGFASVEIDVGVSEFGTLDFSIPCARDTVSLIARGADSYKWDSPSGDRNFISKINDSTYLFDYDQSGEEGPFIFRVMTKTTSLLGAVQLDTTEIKINIESAPPVVNLGRDTVVCEGADFKIESGYKLDDGYSFEWNDGKTTERFFVSESGLYHVVVTDAKGCSGKDTVAVTVRNNPVVRFFNDTAICAGEVLSLNAYNIGLNYIWNTGEQAQIIAADSTGTYGVEVSDGIGCLGSDSVNLIVNVLPEVNLGNDRRICAGEVLNLNASNIGLNYIWNTGEGTQMITADSTGTYGVEVTDDVGCLGSDSVNLIVNELPVVNLGNDTTICEWDQLTLDAGNFGLRYLWITGARTQTIMVNEEAFYHVRVFDEIGCEGSDSINLEVERIPDLFDGEEKQICQGDSVFLFPTLERPLMHTHWLGAENFDDTLLVHETGEYEGMVVGQYCQDTFPIQVWVLDTPQIESIDVMGQNHYCFDFENPVIEIKGRDAEAVDVTWYPGAQVTHVFEPPQAGNYVYIADDGECVSRYEMSVESYCEGQMFIPNAFTPNDNGRNDVFQPISFHVYDYSLFIYDRWGNNVFESVDPEEGWDGTGKSGLEIPSGVYVYKLVYSSLSEQGWKQNRSYIGTVTLVR